MWSLVLAAVSLFIASLTGRRAFATGAVAIFFLLTYTLAEILLQVESAPKAGGGPVQIGPGGVPLPPPPSLAEKVSGLFSPFTLFDGVRMWLGGRGAEVADNVPHIGAFGAVYALVLVVILALCLAGLAARYRKARLS
jgi:ABC-2 type transport system permease protein